MSGQEVNIVITSYNRIDSTKRCIDSVRNTSGVKYILTVVDNNSSDGSQEYLKALLDSNIIDNLFICKHNVGVSIASNLGWASVDTPFYVKLDNDVELLRSDWLSNMLSLSMMAENVGTIGYYIENQRKESESGAYFPVERSVGSCILISKEVHELLGFWNEDYGLYGIEDSDFGTRVIKAGLKNYYVSYSEKYIKHRHNLYLNNKNLDKEIRETHGVSDEYTAMFYFNNALFLSGKRPVYVKRKFLERRRKDGVYEFYPNKEYLRDERAYINERNAFIDEYKKAAANPE